MDGYTDEDGTKHEARALTPEEEARMAEITELLEADEAEAERSAKVERARAAAIKRAAPASPNSPKKRGPMHKRTPEQKLEERVSVSNMLMVRSGSGKLEGAEKEYQQELRLHAQREGLAVNPSSILIDPMFAKRSLSVGTAIEGGNLVTNTDLPYVDGYKPNVVLQELGVDIMDNLYGTASMPVGDFDATAAFATETGAATEIKPTTRKASLTPRRIAAKMQPTYLTLASTGYDAEARLLERLDFAADKVINQVAISGGGANQPTGVLGNADIVDLDALIAGADGGPLDRSMIVKLLNAPAENDANFDGGAFVCTPQVRAQLMNTKTDAGSGLYVWDNNNPNTLMGYKALATTLAPNDGEKGASGATLHSIVFGYWSQLKVARWSIRELLIDPYTQSDAGQVKFSLIQFADVAVANPKAFAGIKVVDVS
jgi:HK97 family phage major capsid protein